MKKSEYRFNFITVASVISAIAVVLLHTNSFWQYSHSLRWELANIVNCSLIFAVPIFFMISGATLIDYSDRYDTKTFLKKRFKKTLIPFIAWSLVAVLIHALFLKDLPKGAYSFQNIIMGVLSATFVPIYWFFIPLFVNYLSMPLFTITRKKDRKNTFRYLIVLGLVLNAAIPFALKLAGINWNFPYTISIISGALYYLVVGYYISHYQISKRMRIIIYLFGLISLLMMILGTSAESHAAGKVMGSWRGLDVITYMLYAPAVFLAIKNITERLRLEEHEKIARFFARFAKYTFAIYLLHYFFLALFEKCIPLSHSSPIYFLIASPVVTILPCVVAMVFRKIPLLKATLPE